jgi:hypothetical protein
MGNSQAALDGNGVIGLGDAAQTILRRDIDTAGDSDRAGWRGISKCWGCSESRSERGGGEDGFNGLAHEVPLRTNIVAPEVAQTFKQSSCHFRISGIFAVTRACSGGVLPNI